MKSVFISSTFKDMQAERDRLHEIVFPKLRKIMQEYGEDIQELDLRWGVDTSDMSEEESGHQVLKVCIDAIDRCHPYIIVLLGERYGWIPDFNVVQSLQDTRMDNLYEEEMSITNLEIRYGALSEEETLKNCVFCFRDSSLIDKIDETHRPLYTSESALHKKKLQLLKDEIRSKKDAIILEYTADWDTEKQAVCGLDAFAKQLTYQLEQMVRRDFAGQEAKHPMEQLHLQMKLRKEQYLASYIPRYREEYLIIPNLRLNFTQIGMTDPLRDQLLIKGVAGSGKSALMASMAHIMEQENCHVISYFSGESGCQNPDSLHRYIIWCLEKIGGYSHKWEGSVTDRLRYVYNELKNDAIFIFIDALDQLLPAGQTNLELLSICPNFCYVLSSLPEFPLEKLAKPLGLSKLKITVLEEFGLMNRRAIVSRTAEKRGKKLDEIVTDMTVREKQAGNPLYLSMLLQRYFMMAQKDFETAEALAPGMEGLHKYMRHLLTEMPDEILPMVRYLLKITGQRFHLTYFREILALLALSKYGLTEWELEGIMSIGSMQFRQLEFQQLVSYLYDAFSQREDGKWCFSHRLFYVAIYEELKEEETAHILNLLANYSLQDEAFLEREGFYYVLTSRHPKGEQILLNVKNWKTKQQVQDLVGEMLSETAKNRTYFLELTSSFAGDKLCEFWSSYQYWYYKEEISTFLAMIWKQLLESTAPSLENRYLCGEKLADYLSDNYISNEAISETKTDLEETFLCCEEMEKLCLQMEEPKKQRYLSRLRTQQAIIHAKQKTEKSLELAWKEYDEAQDILAPVLESLSQWDEKEQKALLRQDAQNKVNYALDVRTYRREVLFGLLENSVNLLKPWIENHGKTNLRETLLTLYIELLLSYQAMGDYPKSITYGELALELSKELLEEEPTLEHRRARIKVLLNYTYSLNGAYRHPYHEEYLSLIRQIAADYPASLEWKEKLADALCLYAYSADLAVKKPSSKMTTKLLADLLHKSEEHWTEGFGLYEELLETVPGEFAKKRITQSVVYYRSVKAITDLERGCRKNALSCALRGLKLVEMYWNPSEKEAEKRSADLRDLNYVVAQAYLDICQSKKALPYAENSVKYADMRHAQTGNTYLPEARALNTYTHVLYELRLDEKALLTAEKAYNCYLGLSRNYEQELAQLHYVQSRIYLAKKDYVKTQEHRDAFAAYYESRSNRFSHGKLLLLDADILGAKRNIPEQTAKLYEAQRFWESCSQMSRDKQHNKFHVDISLDGNHFTTHLCQTDSGDFLRACYYHHYTLQQLVRLGKTIPADTFYKKTIWHYTDNRYLFFLWLPKYYPAFNRLNKCFPKEYVTIKTTEAFSIKEEILIKERAEEIAALSANGDVSWNHISHETYMLSRLAYTGYCNYNSSITSQDKKLRESFQVEEAQDISILQPKWEKLQFSTKEQRRKMVWKPIIELHNLLFCHQDRLSRIEKYNLYSDLANCITYSIDFLDKEDDISSTEVIDLIPEQLLPVLIAQLQEEATRTRERRLVQARCAAEYYRRTKDKSTVLELLDIYKEEYAVVRTDKQRSVVDSIVLLIRLVLLQADEAMIKILLQYLTKNAELLATSHYYTLHQLHRECDETITKTCPTATLILEQSENWWHTINRLYWEKCV